MALESPAKLTVSNSTALSLGPSNTAGLPTIVTSTASLVSPVNVKFKVSGASSASEVQLATVILTVPASSDRAPATATSTAPPALVRTSMSWLPSLMPLSKDTAPTPSLPNTPIVRPASPLPILFRMLTSTSPIVPPGAATDTSSPSATVAVTLPMLPPKELTETLPSDENASTPAIFSPATMTTSSKAIAETCPMLSLAPIIIEGLSQIKNPSPIIEGPSPIKSPSPPAVAVTSPILPSVARMITEPSEAVAVTLPRSPPTFKTKTSSPVTSTISISPSAKPIIPA